MWLVSWDVTNILVAVLSNTGSQHLECMSHHLLLRELVQTSVYSCGFSTPKNLPCTIFFCIGSCGYRAFRLFNRTFGATYCTRQYDYIFTGYGLHGLFTIYIPIGSIMCLSILCAGVSPSIIPDCRLAWQLMTSKQYRKKQL